MIGSALNLKPILQIQGEKLDAYKKVRGMKAAKKNMLDAIKDLEGRFAEYVKNGAFKLHIAYSTSREEAEVWKKKYRKHFQNLKLLAWILLPSVLYAILVLGFWLLQVLIAWSKKASKLLQKIFSKY